jgi:predicted RNase H-like nuclease (RuvC/YqgF family)
LEDLSRIIRDKDIEIEKLDENVAELKEENRSLQQEMIMVKEEAAALTANRGIEMLQKSTNNAKGKPIEDPRLKSLSSGK